MDRGWPRFTAVLIVVVAVGGTVAGLRHESSTSGGSMASKLRPSPTATENPPSLQQRSRAHVARVETALKRRMPVFPAGWQGTEPLSTLTPVAVNREFLGHRDVEIANDGFVGGVGETFVHQGPRGSQIAVNVELWRFASAVGAQSFAADTTVATRTGHGSIWARQFVFPSATNGRGLLGSGRDNDRRYFSLAYDPKGSLWVQTRCFTTGPVTKQLAERYERLALRGGPNRGDDLA